MSTASPPLANWTRPTRWSAAVFAGKVWLLRLRRAAIDLIDGPPALPRSVEAALPVQLASNVTPLWGDPALSERRFQEGKVENLRQAARRFDGTVIGAGQVFSFWRQMGPASPRRGFVVGRMLQQGCLVPAVGGGLCQMSNSLYQAASEAGCDIVERHAHSRTVPGGSAANAGRDATVAWNYVDLRFRAGQDLHLRVFVSDETLTVEMWAQSAAGPPTDHAPEPDRLEARSCGSCNETDCFRHEGQAP
ncbi:hypothetical protein BH11PSE2_BH11PSE2_05420 [soil metagenome]